MKMEGIKKPDFTNDDNWKKAASNLKFKSNYILKILSMEISEKKI